MKFSHKRAVSPIIASLLLIAIAVAAGIIVYVYVNSLAGNLTGGGGNQVSQQIQLQSYSFNPVGTAGFTSSGTSGTGQTIDAFLENTGSSSVVINAVYVDGNQLSEWGAGPATYSKYLDVPVTTTSCYALVPSTGFTATAMTGAQTTANGGASVGTLCSGNTGTCTEAGHSFCIQTGGSGQTETGGSTASPFAAQTSLQLIIGLNYGSAATQGTSHTIKLLTSTGGQAVFTVVAGRSG